MTESQTVEYKEIWKDEYLKHICAFANSLGGTIYIGINDDGLVVGVKNHAMLLEEIPNKAANLMGIVVSVSLHEKNDLKYIEIVVTPSSVPISYHGSYYAKSGSTKQELKGASLQDFLLKKSGRTFDEVPAYGAKINEIDSKAVKLFLTRSLRLNRIVGDSVNDNTDLVLAKLNLTDIDKKIRNSAILLFGLNPQRFFVSATFKIGRFGTSDDDLRFQDVVYGNIFEMPDKVMEILRSKYLISPIRYEGLQRIEELEYPEEALREAILNAIVHKDYTGTSIQLSVYDDKLILWNEGKLPDDLPVEMLFHKHPSKPRNKLIADIFFRAGYIEVWGRGISKIVNACLNAGLPEPKIEVYAGGVQITFYKAVKTGDVTNNETVNETVNILKCIKDKPDITYDELAPILGKSRSTIYRYIQKLVEQGLLIRVGSDKNGYWQPEEKAKSN